MKEVILVDPDPDHANGISNALTAIGCRTIRCPDFRSAVNCLERVAVDVAIIVPHPPEHWRTIMDQFRDVLRARQIDEPSRLVCLLASPYRGPGERVDAARRGFLVMYEQ